MKDAAFERVYKKGWLYTGWSCANVNLSYEGCPEFCDENQFVGRGI